MPRFWNARLELINHKKRKEEQEKREIEKQNRLRKKKEEKSSSTTDEKHEEGSQEEKTETLKQENVMLNRQKYTSHSSSSETEIPSSPAKALSQEMRKNELFKSHERLDGKRSPPPILPKPRPKQKPKLPPININTVPPVTQPISSHAMHEIANEISQNVQDKKNKLSTGSSGDSTDSLDGNVLVKKKVNTPPMVVRKVIKQTRSVDFTDASPKPVQRTQSANPDHTHDSPNSLSLSNKAEEGPSHGNTLKPFLNNDKNHALSRQNAVYFEESLDAGSNLSSSYSKVQSSLDCRENKEMDEHFSRKEEEQSFREKAATIIFNKTRMISNMCWPLGCHYETEDDDPLYSSVDFSTLGYNKNKEQNAEEYQYTDHFDSSTNTAVIVCQNPTYSPTNPRTPPTELPNVVQISPELGIKEVQSILKGGTSYTVGANRDLYALPVKGYSLVNSDDKESLSSRGKNSRQSSKEEETDQDMYSQPLVNTRRRLRSSTSDSDKYDIPAVSEGPYAETVLFEQTPPRPKSQYDTPDSFISMSSTFDLKPPNFKPPPPPQGGSPILRNEKSKLSPVLRHKSKAISPRKTILKDASDSNLDNRKKASKTVSDVGDEPIFATPSSIGIATEDNNNNHQHAMFVSPKELTRREYFLNSDDVTQKNHHSQSVMTDTNSRLLRDPAAVHRDPAVTNREQVKNFQILDNEVFPIVPPPSTSIPLIDTDSLVVPPPPSRTNTELLFNGGHPPPPMYPPPRLHQFDRALVNANAPREMTRWQQLPPPHPELLE